MEKAYQMIPRIITVLVFYLVTANREDETELKISEDLASQSSVSDKIINYWHCGHHPNEPCEGKWNATNVYCRGQIRTKILIWATVTKAVPSYYNSIGGTYSKNHLTIVSSLYNGRK